MMMIYKLSQCPNKLGNSPLLFDGKKIFEVEKNAHEEMCNDAVKFVSSTKLTRKRYFSNLCTM